MNFNKNTANNDNKIPANFSKSVRCFALAAQIRGELEDGTSLDDILTALLPGLDAGRAQEDANLLREGIRSINDALKVEVDTGWVTSQILDAMITLDNKERVIYMSNLLTAVTRVFPEVKVDDETAGVIQGMVDAETNSEEDVKLLLNDVVGQILPELGVLLRKATVSCVVKSGRKINSEQIDNAINFGETFTEAYAAARYVQLKRGDYGETASAIPAFTVGSSTATTLEASKLVSLYASGKLSLRRLEEKLTALYTAAVTFVRENALDMLSRLTYVTLAGAGGVVILMGLLVLGICLQIDLFAILLGSFALTAILFGEVITYEDVNKVISAAWEGMKNLWDHIKTIWKTFTGSDVDEAAETVEAETETETETEAETEAETETETEAETETETETDTETEPDDVDEEDEDEDEDERQGQFDRVRA